MTDWRRRFPFSIGAPSWVLPLEEDNFVGNVEYLSDKVDKVQILCFEREHIDELLNPRDLVRLQEIGVRTGLRYSVHLPGDLALLGPDTPQIRSGKLAQVVKVARLTSKLQPDNFVLHLDFPNDGVPPEGRNDLTLGVLKELTALWSEAPRRVLIENTGWDLTQAASAIGETGFGICADFGHLYRHGLSVGTFLGCFGSSIREVHLHGFGAQGDHLPLSQLPQTVAQSIRAFVLAVRPSVVIENFKAAWMQESLQTLEAWL